MIELGIKGRQETTVTTANVATNVGSGKVQVFATPMMKRDSSAKEPAYFIPSVYGKCAID